jgi:hypothetical protein
MECDSRCDSLEIDLEDTICVDFDVLCVPERLLVVEAVTAVQISPTRSSLATLLMKRVIWQIAVLHWAGTNITLPFDLLTLTYYPVPQPF